MRRWIGLAALLAPALLAPALLGSCAAPAKGGAPSRPVRSVAPDPIEPLLRWREAERRRDLELALEVLHLSTQRDREYLEAHLDALRAVPAGPVRARPEFHLVAGPTPWGELLFLALEPAGAGHALVRYELTASRAPQRLVFEAPPDGAGAALERERQRWRAAHGQELERALERLRWTLAGQLRALDLARREGAALPPFEPHPAPLLAALEGLDPQAARALVLSWLSP